MSSRRLRVIGVLALGAAATACAAAAPTGVQEPAAAPTTAAAIQTADAPAADTPTAGTPTAGTTGVGSPPTASPPTPDASTAAAKGRAPSTTTAASAAGAGSWVLGATPLPKGPDGTPLVLPTPAALRDRRLPTTDRLPPPPAGAPYQSTASPIDAAMAARMGDTYKPGCPVGLGDLRHLTMSFWGFDGRPHTGELVVNASVAAAVQKVFGRLFTARFPLEDVRIVEPADLTAEPTGDGNETAAFVCRPVRGTTSTPSAHSYGLAVDINPFQNPYHKGASVLPELASAYLDRSARRPGMIESGDVVTRAFAEAGWTWGGSWTSTKDIMHFSANGR